MYKKRIVRAVKINLYPNCKQIEKIEFLINGNRWIWNYFLALQTENKKEGKQFITEYKMHSIFRELKKDENYKWLKDLHSHSVAATLFRLTLAFKNFFRKNKFDKNVGYPKFKSKKNIYESITYPDEVQIKKNKILLGKVGYVRARGFRQFENMKIKQVVIKRVAIGKYEAIYFVECDNTFIIPKGRIQSVGIDMGVNKFLTDSNGKKMRPFNYKKEINNIKILQQQLEKNKIGKLKKDKLKFLIAKLYRKITNKRINWLHHISNKYVKFRNVYVEDLSIKKMTRNISGTIESPNIESKAKSNLNNVILQQGWGIFFNILKYKIEDRKGIFYKVDPTFTSQQCSKCNFVDKLSRSKEKFKCTKCGHEMDADHNAAVNILNRGYQDLHLANKI